MKNCCVTDKQRSLIEDMNEFCDEKFNFENKTKEDASKYISKNIKEFKLKIMDNWQYQYI